MTITRNAFASVMQVAIGAGIQFVVYRIILDSLGAEQLGLWSIVLATTSASRIGELGLSASVTRFVAKYRALEDDTKVSSILQTAAITILVLLSVLLIVVYPILQWLFQKLFPIDALAEARAILPFALSSLILNSVAAVFQSGLDGCQRHDKRATLVLSTQVGFLFLALWLVPAYGLLGMAWAQIGQATILALAGWILLRGVISNLPWIPCRWQRRSFHEMLSYGAQFQLGAMAMALFEPLTKALLGKFGGLSAAGYYELARQFVGTMRLLVVSANQVLIPVAASLNESDPASLRRLYEANIGYLSFIVLPLYALVISCAPLVSELWLGELQPPFVFFVNVLTIAWTVNTLASPAYFAQMGTGRIFWNTAAHVWMGICNAAFGFALGPYFGSAGIAAGMSVALISGSLIVIGGFHRVHRIPWARLMPPNSFWLLIASLLAGISGQRLYFALIDEMLSMRFILCLAWPVAIVFPAAWFHPLRRQLVLRVRSVLVRKCDV